MDTEENEALALSISKLVNGNTEKVFQDTIKAIFDNLKPEFYMREGNGYFNMTVYGSADDADPIYFGTLTKHYTMDNLMDMWIQEIEDIDDINKPYYIDSLEDKAKIFDDLAKRLRSCSADFKNNTPSTGFKP